MKCAALWVCSWALALSASVAFAPRSFGADARAPDPKDEPTLMCERGKALLSEDFSGSTLPAAWKVAKGKWNVSDGFVKGTEQASDMHAAVLAHELKTHDLIGQISFRLDGAKSMAFSLNNAKGHVSRVTITPAGLALQKDKAGKTSDDKPALLGRVASPIQAGEWHTLLVEVHGKDMVVSIDGGAKALAGSHDGIDVDKTSLHFPASGDSISIAHVRVWEAGAVKGDWEATKLKLEAGKGKAAAASAQK